MPGLESKGAAPPTEAGIANIAFRAFARSSGGTQSITGLGFKPKLIYFSACPENVGAPYTHAWSKGWDKGGTDVETLRICLYKYGDSDLIEGSDTYSIVLFVDGSNYLIGYVESMDDDGFTINWTLVGNVSLVGDWMALK